MIGRYSRQSLLPGIGDEGQARLGAAHVLVVGAGGLGCALLPWLAGAGVGRLVIIDDDAIEESNLHRQPLYRASDIGRAKAEVAREFLRAYNPLIVVEAQTMRLAPDNAQRLADGADLVVDAADSFAATYVLSDACQAGGKPLVSASVVGMSGYAGVFCGGGPSYRAVFPDMPTIAADCATAGVLGPIVAIVGALQARMSLAMLLGLNPSPLSTLTSYDDAKHPAFGGFGFAGAPEPDSFIPFIAPGEIAATDIVVDLRGAEEAPTPAAPWAIRSGVAEIHALAPRLPEGVRVVLCCRTGLRASRAADILRSKGRENLALVAFG
ncbi:MAG TPA: HesA/MoeB/ThiF family protein [Beijerinckiaceae bacterium]|nr:HesA/MoeB/ThiF family protein [Beijerinckiaceae bacterium]